MLARTPIGTRFYNYVSGQNPNDWYHWPNMATCACGKFIMDEKIELNDQEFEAVWGRERSAPMTRLGDLNPSSLNVIAYGHGFRDDWTFGKLRERLDAAGYAMA